MKYLTTEEFANLLHCNRRLISDYRRAGLIKAIRAGKTYVYDEEDIKEFCKLVKGYDIRNPSEIECLKRKLQEGEKYEI